MCGFVGIVTPWTERPSLSDAQLVRMNDVIAHRGPDAEGIWRKGPAALAHRRLRVVDLSEDGHQPMVAGDRALVYNGELYNDLDLRRSLASDGREFGSVCDTETLLALLERYGWQGLEKARGMFALAWVDLRTRELVLARDPFGIKPLYFWKGQIDGVTSVMFASEEQAILAHPSVPIRPDAIGVSAYLTTLRTSVDDRTMFEGIKSVRPGEVLRIDLDHPDLPVKTVASWTPESRAMQHPATEMHGQLAAMVEESVRLHLRSDVPSCCLLSGGLDSTLIASMVARHDPALSTYCAGAPMGAPDDDLTFAAEAATALGVRHVRTEIQSDLFLERWPAMVNAMGLPMTTPNEVAINRVAHALRAEGKIVALSGEGADELFAGYEVPISLAWTHVQAGNTDPGVFQLCAHAWMDPSLKPTAFEPEFLAMAEHDTWLLETYRSLHERCRNEPGADHPMEAHLRMHRRVNLTGLLARLDRATMLESVEGRTPFADREIANAAASIGFDQKATVDDGTVTGTKIALRAASVGLVPESIVSRPKASFPLPFQDWIAPAVVQTVTSPFLREVYTPGAIAAIAADPCTNWNLAWPMANLALWGDRWWGEGRLGESIGAGLSQAV